MKKLSGVILATFVLMLVGTAMSQSLADQAKAVRQQSKKSATKVYTEDDLPSVPESKMAEESHAAEATATNAEAAKEAPSAAAASGDAGASDANKEDEAAAKEKEEAAKVAAEAQANDLKAKVSDKQEEVKSLEKELDLMQRENKLRQASYYGDAGTQLRDQKKWADEQRQYQTDLEAKQKALAEAKEKLDDTREQARKSGISESKLE
jgi:hypothetical protein